MNEAESTAAEVAAPEAAPVIEAEKAEEKKEEEQKEEEEKEEEKAEENKENSGGGGDVPPVGRGLLMGAAVGAGARVGKGFMSAFTAGSLFIVLALIINLFLDLFTPWGFAGFDFSKYSSVKSLTEISGLLMVVYMIIKGPLLVLSLAIGAAALEKRHIGMRVFLASIIIFYTTSLLPPILQGYFLLAGIDLFMFIIIGNRSGPH